MGEPDQARLEHWEEMLKAWGVADEKFTSRDIFGEKVSKVILQHAAVAACHELPYALSIMANLMACTNGAQVSPCLVVSERSMTPAEPWLMAVASPLPAPD